MVSDGHAKGKPEFEGFSLSLDAKDEAEAERCSTRWPKAARCRCR